MNTVKITLQYRSGAVLTMEVSQELIAEASILEYQQSYFTYGGMGGRFFSEVRFNEVNPPVLLEGISGPP